MVIQIGTAEVRFDELFRVVCRGRVGDAAELEKKLGRDEAVFAQEIAQLRARKDAQLRHASLQVL